MWDLSTLFRCILIVGGVFSVVCDTWSQTSWLQSAQQMHAEKKSPHFRWEGETHLLLNIKKYLETNRFFEEMHKYCTSDLFKRVVGQMKEGWCVRTKKIQF